VLGLTPGEARIASPVGSGLLPREAVEELGISEETARTVLERVFSKVGVARQSELAALTTKQDCEAHCPWSYQASNFR
jgi:DNA-binding CsgD family transcriptional regulator